MLRFQHCGGHRVCESPSYRQRVVSLYMFLDKSVISQKESLVMTDYLGNRDLRQASIAQWQNAENHDDITAVDFQPGQTSTVLAGGDDGQVSIFDSRIAEEQDSLIQGFNHGPIHKAGFLSLDTIYALSSDQDLALHPVFDDAREEEPQPLQLGDLRPKVPCEYVIDILRTGDDSIIAAGSHRFVKALRLHVRC